MRWKVKKITLTYEQIISYGFIAVLSVAFLFSFHKDRTFSDVENRNLQTFPEFHLQDFFNHRFQTTFQNYKNDQFLFRDNWMHAKTKMDVSLGKRELNQVYLGSDDQVFESFHPEISNQELQETLQSFADQYKDKRISLMLVPNPLEIWKEKLPAYAPVVSQASYLNELQSHLPESIKWIDVEAKLQEHQSEYIYYRSDHHWTTLGARYGFEAYAQAADLKVNMEEWTTALVSDSFYGTLAGKSGYVPAHADEISVYLPVQPVQYIVQYVEEEDKSTSVYKTENLMKRDQYSLFLDGNHPLIQIDTNSKYDKRLLVFKDSYANSMLPFLLPYYSKIVLVDPRYYSEDVHALIQDHEITDILFLYNVNTFYQDASLSLLLKP